MSGGVHCEMHQLLDKFFHFLDFINCHSSVNGYRIAFSFQGLSVASMTWYYDAQSPHQLPLHLAKVTVWFAVSA
jgi:hypothetical protein